MEPEKIDVAEINGKIQLNDGATPDQVYVWLESLNLGAFTDKNGNFSIPIPQALIQGSESSLTGFYKLYFYIADYKIVYESIEFAEGRIAEDQLNIKKDGDLKKIINLQQLLKITISPKRTSITLGNSSLFTFTVKFSSSYNFINTKMIAHIRRQGAPLYYGLVFQPTDLPADSTKFYDCQESIPYYKTIYRDSPLTIEYKMNIDSLYLSPGEYTVFPYVTVLQQEPIPSKILNNIGYHYDVFGVDYHILPMKMEKFFLTVN